MAETGANLVTVLVGWLKGLLGVGDDVAGDEGRRLDATIVEITAGVGPGWGSLSGLTSHPTNPTLLYAVPDQDSPPPRILEIDVASGGARVVGQIPLLAANEPGLDTESISAKPQGGFWIGSEGGDYDEPPNRLLEVDGGGRILRTLRLPASIAPRMLGKGFEGVAYVAGPDGERVYAAIQQPIDGDPDELTRIACVDPATGEWRFWHYPLERLESGHVSGLSELLHISGTRFAAIERDGKGGRHSLKWVTTFDLGQAPGVAADAVPPVVTKHVAVDLVPIFLDDDRKVAKEIEGLTIASDGQVYALTDNDTDPERPTLLLRLGPASEVFR